MPKYSEEMTTLNTRQPVSLKSQVQDALRTGETLSDFLRAALVRELRRRGIKAEMPDVKMGPPRKS